MAGKENQSPVQLPVQLWEPGKQISDQCADVLLLHRQSISKKIAGFPL